MLDLKRQGRTREMVAKLLDAVDRAAKALAEAQQMERELAAMSQRETTRRTRRPRQALTKNWSL